MFPLSSRHFPVYNVSFLLSKSLLSSVLPSSNNGDRFVQFVLEGSVCVCYTLVQLLIHLAGSVSEMPLQCTSSLSIPMAIICPLVLWAFGPRWTLRTHPIKGSLGHHPLSLVEVHESFLSVCPSYLSTHPQFLYLPGSIRSLSSSPFPPDIPRNWVFY